MRGIGPRFYDYAPRRRQRNSPRRWTTQSSWRSSVTPVQLPVKAQMPSPGSFSHWFSRAVYNGERPPKYQQFNPNFHRRVFAISATTRLRHRSAEDGSVAEMLPFQAQFDVNAISDLRERLRRTRWPESETVDDWSQ